MFFTTHVTIEADHRRQALLDDAASYRLAKLARAGRRRKPAMTAPSELKPRPDVSRPARPPATRAA